MQKRIVAIALCLVMVSAFTVTGAVSATSVGKSNIRTFDVWLDNHVVGKATLNLKTGHLVITVNVNNVPGLDPPYEGWSTPVDVWSPSGDYNSLYTASEYLTITFTADGTATLDTYLDPMLVTDPGFVDLYWNDPSTIMFLE
ncbi:MAG: hypothetical protein ACXV3E_07170 [Halobacteriota archaeon]